MNFGSIGSSFKDKFGSKPPTDDESKLGPEGKQTWADKHPDIARGLKAAAGATKKPLPKAPAQSSSKGEDEPLPNSGITAATKQRFAAIDQPDAASSFQTPQISPQVTPPASLPDQPSAANTAPTPGAVKGSLKKGTPYVPETGLFKLHKGERVIPRNENEKLFDSGPGRTSKKEIKSIAIKKAHGGFLLNHAHHNHPDEEHAVSSLADLHKHIDKHNSAMTASSSEN